jgi:hypothetical protein
LVPCSLERDRKIYDERNSWGTERNIELGRETRACKNRTRKKAKGRGTSSWEILHGTLLLLICYILFSSIKRSKKAEKREKKKGEEKRERNRKKRRESSAIANSALISLGARAQVSKRVEAPDESTEEGLTAHKSGLVRGLVRRLSSGGGIGRSARAISSYVCGSSGGGGGGDPGPSDGDSRPCNGACRDSGSGSGYVAVAGQQPVVGAGSTTVSASGAPPGRGTPSRRSSRDLSPLKKSPAATGQQDAAASHGGGGGAGAASTSGGSAAGSTGQDWRKLVGSIRRKVRRKTTQNSSSISEVTLQETTNRNQDDFLKATMRIFLVVSPPMGRVQVNACVLAAPSCRLYRSKYEFLCSLSWSY